jgi:hypothetical protein
MCSSRAYLISETCPRQDWIPGSIRVLYCISQGRIQDLKLGGWDALKNIAPSGGRREHFWVISCEKSRFYAKKSYFFQLRREARTFLGGLQGRIQGAPGAPAPLKLEKIWFFCVKSWFFTRNTSKMFALPSAIGKNMIFLRKIVIFHTKYPKNVRASLRNWKKYYFLA